MYQSPNLPVELEDKLQLAKAGFGKLLAEASSEEKDAILQIYFLDEIGLSRGESAWVAALLKARNAEEALAKRKDEALKAEAFDLRRPSNLIESIHFAKNKAPVNTVALNIPTWDAIYRVRRYLGEFLHQISEHAGRKALLSAKGGYLEVIGDPFIKKFSLDSQRGGGFWMTDHPKLKTPCMVPT
jgi:hypothetical protein